MTAALGNTAQGTPFATGVDAFVYPQFIGYAQRAPTSQDIYNPGTRWQNNSVNPPVIYQTSGAGVWNISSTGGSGTFTSLVVTPGPASITGTTSINTSGSGSTTIGTGGTGAVNIGNATGGTAITGATTMSGNLTFGSAAVGDIHVVTAVTGASPQIANARVFSVTFSGVNIAADATQSFTISNSVITGASTVIQYTMVGATTGAALNIQSVTNSASQSVIVVENGTGATTSTANISFVGTVLN